METPIVPELNPPQRGAGFRDVVQYRADTLFARGGFAARRFGEKHLSVLCVSLW